MDNNKTTQQEFKIKFDNLMAVALDVLSDNVILIEMYNEKEIDDFDILMQAEQKIMQAENDLESFSHNFSDFFSDNNPIESMIEHRDNQSIVVWNKALREVLCIAASCFKIKDLVIERWTQNKLTDIDIICKAYEVLKNDKNCRN